MIERQTLVTAFARNLAIAEAQAAGLSQAEALLQPPFRGNCFNWILGHIVASRDDILAALGAEKLLGGAAARYDMGSEPILADGPGVIPLVQLLELMRASGDTLAITLPNAADDDLTKTIQVRDRENKVGDRVFFLYFHESYHIGQLELLRQLAGKNDKII